jgi:hypothetical protein
VVVVVVSKTAELLQQAEQVVEVLDTQIAQVEMEHLILAVVEVVLVTTLLTRAATAVQVL